MKKYMIKCCHTDGNSKVYMLDGMNVLSVVNFVSVMLRTDFPNSPANGWVFEVSLI